MDVRERQGAVAALPSPPTETPPPPPPESPSSSPTQTPSSFVNPSQNSEMQRDRGPLWVPPPPAQPPVPVQSHRPFSSSIPPKPCSILGPPPRIGNPNQNNGIIMMGQTQIEPSFQIQPPIGGGALSYCQQGAMRPPPSPAQMQPPIGAPSHFEQGTMTPLCMRPPPPQPAHQMQPPVGAPLHFEQGRMMPLAMPMRQPAPVQMHPPIGAPSHFQQGMMPLPMRPPPPSQGIWPCFPPAQRMNHGFENNGGFRPLDLGNFPPWQITVSVAGGETRHINIPSSEGIHVIGLPLGLDVPQVIAGHYEGLLRMVQGMRNVITDIVRDLARCQQDAARFWQDANCYYCELEELKLRMAANMVVSDDLMALQTPVSPTKKRKMFPGDSSSAMPASAVSQVQASVTKYIENDIPITDVEYSQRKSVNEETLLCCSEVVVETAESSEFVEPVGQSVEATMASSSTMSLAEGFEFPANLEVPREYENLYNNIFKKYSDTPIGGALSHSEQGMMPLAKKPGPPPPPAQMQPPLGAHSHFEQGMIPLAMRPPPPPPTQGHWPYFRPLGLGNFPPWQITIDVGGGETRHINIPSSEGNHVVGLPLGLDVPKVIAGRYEGLLRMVQGMRNVITDIVRELAQCQQDAARFWQDANRYYCEVEELKLRMAGNMVPQDSMAPVSPTKKRKTVTGESVPCEAKTVQIHKPEHLPLSIRSCGGTSSAMPASNASVVKVPITKDNKKAISLTSVNCLQGEETSLLCCSEVQTETVEFVKPVEEFIEATTMTSSSTCSRTVEATVTSCQTDGSEFMQNLEIPKEYESLYTCICKRHGDMVARKDTKSNNDLLLSLVIRLLKINSAIETMPVSELSETLLEKWEEDIKYAESLDFNIKWLRQRFNEVQKYWVWRLDKDVERHEQELDSVQRKYAGLWARKEELDKEIAEVKVEIRNAGAKISSEREAVHDKLAQIFTLLYILSKSE